MKKLFRNVSTTLAATLLAMAALTSCGGSDSLQSNIPADIDWAIKFDLAQVIDNAGGSIDSDGSISFPALTANTPMAGMILDNVNQFVKCIDMTSMVVFDRHDSKPVLIAKLHDADAAKTRIKKYLKEADSTDGYEVYKYNGIAVAFKNDMLYVADDIDYITESAEAASKKDISALPAIQQWLNEPNFISVVASPEVLGLPTNFSQYWLVADAAFDNQTASGEIAMMDIDGKRYNFGEAFGVIDNDFLRYIPENAQGVMALGKIESPEIRNSLNNLAAQMGDASQLITNLDGTMSLAVAVDSSFNAIAFTEKAQLGHLDLKGIDFVAMVHYPQATVDYMIKSLNDMAAQSGQIAKTEANGMQSVMYDGTEYLYGNVDGYFAIADYDLTSEGNTDFAPLVDGTRGVIASISEPGDNMYGFEWGSTSRLWLTADAIKGECKVTNTSKKLLEVFIDAFNNPIFRQQILEAIQEAGNSADMLPDESFGGYSDDDDFFVDYADELSGE